MSRLQVSHISDISELNTGISVSALCHEALKLSERLNTDFHMIAVYLKKLSDQKDSAF